MTDTPWVGGVVERVCDGTWVMPGNGKRTKCEKGKAAEVLWDFLPDVGLPACRCRSIEPLI